MGKKKRKYAPPHKQAEYRRRYLYGHCINYDDFMLNYHNQDVCELCGACFDDTNRRRKCVDHHGNWIRGIICNSCNKGLGALGDTMRDIENAYSYMKERHNEPS